METKQQKLEAVLGRAMRDTNFRQKLTSNPKQVAIEEGLGAEELEIIAGGVAIGNNPNMMAFCSAKTCNEKGGVRD